MFEITMQYIENLIAADLPESPRAYAEIVGGRMRQINKRIREDQPNLTQEQRRKIAERMVVLHTRLRDHSEAMVKKYDRMLKVYCALAVMAVLILTLAFAGGAL